MTKLHFFTHALPAQFSPFVNGGRELAIGQLAEVPSLPGLKIFYSNNTENGRIKHRLTEATSGLSIAMADSRAELHKDLAFAVRFRGLEAIKARVHECVMSQAATLYFISCPKPRRRKAKQPAKR
jgi:hypothetical protein